MRKSKLKVITLSILLLIAVCYAAWQAFLADKYYRKVDVAYAAWRQPDQEDTDWSNTVFTSNVPSFYDLKLVGKNFSEANFSHGGFIQTHFENTKFIHANMKNSDFSFCVFKWCDLRKVDLRNADLRYVLFWHVDLRGANLEGASLAGACIWDTNLNGVNLTGAHLHAAWFRKLDLRNTNLKGAEMGVMYDSQTKWPKGFDVNKDDSFLDNRPPVLGGR
jgi:uncharacterized protein YjbI with pentapeptide repeats